MLSFLSLQLAPCLLHSERYLSNRETVVSYLLDIARSSPRSSFLLKNIFLINSNLMLDRM